MEPAGYFREDNENEARAKNAEYRELLQHQQYLFINITGKTAGESLKVDSVYDMLKRMKKKTGKQKSRDPVKDLRRTGCMY